MSSFFFAWAGPFEYITSRLIQTIANIRVLTVDKAVYTLWNLLHRFQINRFTYKLFEAVLMAAPRNKLWPSDLIRLDFVTYLLEKGNLVVKNSSAGDATASLHQKNI